MTQVRETAQALSSTDFDFEEEALWGQPLELFAREGARATEGGPGGGGDGLGVCRLIARDEGLVTGAGLMPRTKRLTVSMSQRPDISIVRCKRVC